MMNAIFFGPAQLIAAWPHAGWLIGSMLIVASLLRRPPPAEGRRVFRRAAVLAGFLWMLFTLYEWQVAAVWGGGAMLLRYDLIVLVPVLYTLTVAGLWELWRGAPKDGG